MLKNANCVAGVERDVRALGLPIRRFPPADALYDSGRKPGGTLCEDWFEIPISARTGAAIVDGYAGKAVTCRGMRKRRI
jgi:hypothetical protein